MKKLLPILLALISLLPLSAITPEEADAKLKARIGKSAVIVDICIYEQQWISPNGEFPKGRLVKRAVVTEAYKGNGLVALGSKLEFDELTDESPGAIGDFTAPVEGELRTLFSIRGPVGRGANGMQYFGGECVAGMPGFNEGKAMKAFNNWSFSRIAGVFADAFMMAKKDKTNFTRIGTGLDPTQN